ncbi:hypothetical protein VTK56DRAFT_7161 [Thermocarpiscus australiensis]
MHIAIFRLLAGSRRPTRQFSMLSQGFHRVRQSRFSSGRTVPVSGVEPMERILKWVRVSVAGRFWIPSARKQGAKRQGMCRCGRKCTAQGSGEKDKPRCGQQEIRKTNHLRVRQACGHILGQIPDSSSQIILRLRPSQLSPEHGGSQRLARGRLPADRIPVPVRVPAR